MSWVTRQGPPRHPSFGAFVRHIGCRAPGIPFDSFSADPAERVSSMLSAKSLFQEILDNDESFRLFCSIAASGESQGGWENARIAALVPPSARELAPKITRHGADEDKHGRIFNALMNKRGLTPVEVPADTDYTMLLERHGIGLAHDKLKSRQPLTVRDIVTYLAHSRVTEQRASEQMELLLRHFADHPDIGHAVRMISEDED